uniref:Uncharacterized protein n=1 Tax=Anguilla anguilla TaxID=7936 RepID=A0A0E9V6I3_ANGAN
MLFCHLNAQNGCHFRTSRNPPPLTALQKSVEGLQLHPSPLKSLIRL